MSAIDTTTNNVTSFVLHRQAVDVAVSTTARPKTLNYTCKFFDYPGAIQTRGWAINDWGTVLGDYTDSSGNQHGSSRTADGKFIMIDVPGRTTQVLGINNFGVLVGSYVDSNGLGHGCKRTQNGTVTTIDYPGALESGVSDINDFGDIIGVYGGDTTTVIGFLIHQGVYRSLENSDAAPMQTDPFDINNLGRICGTFIDSSGQEHAFILNGINYTTVDFSMADGTVGSKLNDLGQVIGSYSGSGPGHGFLFNSQRVGFLSFEPPDVAATQTHAINNRVQITGNYRPFSDNSRHGFIATPVKSTD